MSGVKAFMDDSDGFYRSGMEAGLEGDDLRILTEEGLVRLASQRYALPSVAATHLYQSLWDGVGAGRSMRTNGARGLAEKEQVAAG